MRIEMAQLSDIGCARETNEDALSVLPEQQIFVLADGMGGHNAGEIASQMACRLIPRFLQEKSTEAGDPRQILEDCIQQTHRAIYQESESNTEYKGMGTTVEVAWLKGRSLFWAHVGDSRIYLFRKDQLTQLTEDHSLVNDYLKKGIMTEEQARNTPMRNVILQAVGAADKIKVQTGCVDWESGDIFLLCSDGLSDIVEDEEIKMILSGASDPESCARNLIERAKNLGAPDNVSVVLLGVY